MAHNKNKIMTRGNIGNKVFQWSKQSVSMVETKCFHDGNKVFPCWEQLRTLILFLMVTLGSTTVWGQITPTTDTDNPVYYLFQSFGNTGFYMRPNGTNVNTSNILTDDMKWYFLDSGESGYYYICDKDGNYLYFSKPSGSQSSRTWMELKSLDNNDTEHYKFSIAKNNTKGWNAYNIIPYGNTGNYCLNKQGKNAGTGNVQVSNGWDDENSNWVFIPMTDYVWTLRADCFRPSDSSNKYFYKIKSKVNASYYIKPGTNYVGTSNTVDDDMIWYFEEASSDDFMTYYYIRLANDGQYLKYRNNGDDAIQLANHTGSETGDAEDRFQFIVVRGAVSDESWNTTNISYNIVPKLLKRTNNSLNFYCVSSNKGLGKPLKIRNDRASTDNKWNFESVVFSTICADPTITFSNTTGKASITTTTTRSTIYYTTDGSEPSSSNGTPYTEPFKVTEQTTIKAIVTRTDFSNSQVTTKTIDKVAAPTIVNTEASVISITTATNGATIYYTTDGSTPTTSSTVYTGPVTITASIVTIKAIAVKDGMINSAVSSESFAFACATPVISFNNATLEVTITCETEGSTIYYTTDGTTTPTASSTPYNGPFSVTSPTTVKAIATHAGLDPSSVAELVISQVATPTIQDNGSNAISITSATSGATIYYTTDGSTPTTGSTPYASPLTENVSNVTIKAIAVKENMITSAVGSGLVKLKCAAPVVTRDGMQFTLSCSMPTDATLYYSIDGGSQTQYNNSPVTFTVDQLPITVTAVAKHSDYYDSDPTSLTLTKGEGTASSPYLIYGASDFTSFVTNVNNGTTADKCYLLCTDVSASGIGAITEEFSGTFDGGGYTISGLTHPLFNTVNGGVVKNVTLKNVAISSSEDYVGAIAGIAQGYSRIYNCGILPNDATFPEGTHPTVTTSGACAGGIVGSLEDDSRVINCYSYADVSATTTASGIVGQNTFASTAAVSDGKYANLRTAVVNCMFYGNITGGGSQYGVYGGQLITNATTTGISSYNYYRNGSTFTTSSGEPTAYNCSFPAEERYLTQVEFHRSLLNSNRELCGWWVGSDVAPSTMSTTDVQAIPKNASIMYKWVVDPSLAPYPILKPFGKYASVVNSNTGTPWFDRDTAKPYEGKKLGTLKVNVQSGDHSTAADRTLYLPITDIDTLHYDYGYYKVQLPYYNTVFGDPSSDVWATRYANNYTDQVVTGWMVTEVDHEGANSFVANWQDGYNFADRDCTDKDLYATSDRVFAQGGYYYVPNGVTEITIKAYWGKAIYVRNDGSSYDRVNITVGTTGTHFAPAGTRDNNVNGQTIQTTTIKGSLTNTNIDAKKTVYDYALVLVGNIQESLGNVGIKHATQDTRGFTIMSADFDFDEEPDYCLEWQLGAEFKRQEISPVRFDFLPVVELGIAGKLHNSTSFFSLGCYRSKGHFEVTETAFIRFGQFEFELPTRDDGPIILNGGIYDQYCRGRNGETNQHITYVILGGHIVMPSFTPGAHANKDHPYQTRHCAVNALGGYFNNFYLTGGYNEGVTPYADNPHCYIDGGHFGTIAAACKEGISGDVTWRINHALIDEFYGGGVMSQATGTTYKIVKGNIDVVINNSIVGKYCGGPKFGDMVSGKTVKTSATNTIFTEFYGAGNGGTNYVQYKNYDDTGVPNPNWNTLMGSNYNVNNHVGKYRNTAQGYEANYDLEQINGSDGTSAGKMVNRIYYYSAQFATTNTGSVTNELTDCTFKQNFYGGGFLGGVNGDITSTLTNCTILGSVFGAGFSASAGTVTIHDKNKTPPSANVYTGMIKPQSGGTSTTYYWTHDSGSTSSPVTAATAGEDHDYYYTEIPLDNLGAVNGNVTVTLKGTTKVGYDEDDNPVAGGGHVYGGGDASAVTGSGNKVTVNLEDNTKVLGNVFGGGNEGPVEGSTEVNIGAAPAVTPTP